jgi:ATP-dependent Zn protease
MRKIQVTDDRKLNFRPQLLLITIVSLTIGLSSCFGNVAREVIKSDRLSQVKKSLGYNEFIQQVQQGKIKKVGLSPDRTKVLIKDKDGAEIVVNLPPKDNGLIDILTKNSVEVYVLPSN